MFERCPGRHPIPLPKRLFPFGSSLRRTSTTYNELLSGVYCVCEELLAESAAVAEDDVAVFDATLYALDVFSSEFPE